MNRIAIAVLIMLVLATAWQLDRRSQYQHGFIIGKNTVQTNWDKAVREQQQTAFQISVEADRLQAQAQEKIRTIYQTITQESIRYVQNHPVACSLDDEWLRIHNAAARGNTDPAASIADGPS